MYIQHILFLLLDKPDFGVVSEGAADGLVERNRLAVLKAQSGKIVIFKNQTKEKKRGEQKEN